MAVEFPASPTLGQRFVAENTVTYTWLGNRWSSETAIESGLAEYYVEGGRADFVYDPTTNTILDGGTAANGPTPTIVTYLSGDSELSVGDYSEYANIAYSIENPFGSSIVEAGVFHTLGIDITSYDSETLGSYLYTTAVEYCDNNFPGYQGIQRYVLRDGNDATQNYANCSAAVTASPSLGTTIKQRIHAWYSGLQDYTVCAYAKNSDGTIFVSERITWSAYGPCFVEGTLITLADGTTKAVEDITYDDDILVWDFDHGTYAEAKPIWVKQPQQLDRHNRLTFSDGTVLLTVFNHEIFNKQAGAFTKPMTDATPIGTITYNQMGEEVTLVSKEVIREPVTYYNVWTEYHLNLFAEGILTSNRFNNIYPIVAMKFVKDDRALRPVEEFVGIDDKYIKGLRLQEQTYSVDYIRDYINERLVKLNITQAVEV
jgi:hypothetical protein